MWIKMCQFILLIQLVYNQTTLRVDGGWIIVLNATFNNISNAPWRSVLLVEETQRKPPTCRKSLTNFIR